MNVNCCSPAKVLAIPLIFFVVIVLIGMVATPVSQDVSVDFAAHYAKPGVYSRDSTMDTILTDLVALSVFHDVRTNITHAETRHGSDAQQVRDCLENGSGTMMAFANPKTGHCVEITQLPDGRFGVRVIQEIDGWFEEITAFVDDAADLGQLEWYLNGQGYMVMWPF